MREIFQEKLKDIKEKELKYNILREMLQETILQILDRNRNFKNIAFVGGTALRIIHGLQRFSEDLDFSLIKKAGFDFNRMLKTLEKDLRLSGLEVEISKKTNQTVYAAFIKFKDLLFEFGISPHKNEKLSIKLEVDSNPPRGHIRELSFVNRTFIFKVLTFDQASLFAGKLHAFLFRRFAKERDYYDLFWFLTKKAPVNYILLNNAARQTQGDIETITPENLKVLLRKKVNSTNFPRIIAALRPFLVDKNEIELVKKEHLLSVIEKAGL